jgi:hemerythrin-like domain-containing protein
MTVETLAEALEREHREIDEGIAAFTAARAEGRVDRQPLSRAVEALRRHIYLEEEFLFPPLRSAGMVMPVFVMLREHGEMWRMLDALEAEVAKDAGSESVSSLVDGLVPRLEAHNEKEEAILYPQADTALAGSAGEELKKFMAHGRMPEGWVCELIRA